MYLADEAVEIGVGRPLNVQVSSTDVVDGLVVDHKGTVRVLQGGMGSQDGVVRLNDSCGDLWKTIYVHNLKLFIPQPFKQTLTLNNELW